MELSEGRATQLVLTAITQIAPITDTTAQVKVSLELFGGLPDFVQIYAAPAGGGVESAELVCDVPMKSGQTQYDQVITLHAATYYAIYACPRMGSQNSPDDQTDGQYWESSCAAKYFITKVKSTATAETLNPPVITNLEPKPATLNQGNSIIVSWSSSTSYDKYVLGWTQDGIEMQPQDIKQSGSSGSWTAPTIPNHNYTFHVNGGISQFWNYKYSAWGPTVTAVAGPNLTSLRQYLQESGINPSGQSLRSLMLAGQTLRQFMQLW